MISQGVQGCCKLASILHMAAVEVPPVEDLSAKYKKGLELLRIQCDRLNKYSFMFKII